MWADPCKDSIGKSTAGYKAAINSAVQRGGTARLYFLLMYRNSIPHRFLMLPGLSASSL